MSPTKQNNSLTTTKQSTTSAMTTKKVKKAGPKASTAIITTNGEVIVRQILQGTYVHDSRARCMLQPLTSKKSRTLLMFDIHLLFSVIFYSIV